MTIPKTVTKHDIGRRYTKIVRKILRLSEKVVEAELLIEDSIHWSALINSEEAVQEASVARANLESYVHQSLKEFRELIESQQTVYMGWDKAAPGEDYTVFGVKDFSSISDEEYQERLEWWDKTIHKLRHKDIQ